MNVDELDGEKVYVVYEGGKPGIYYAWWSCGVDPSNLNECKYKAFDTYEDAESEWLQYCHFRKHQQEKPDAHMGGDKHKRSSNGVGCSYRRQRTGLWLFFMCLPLFIHIVIVGRLIFFTQRYKMCDFVVRDICWAVGSGHGF